MRICPGCGIIAPLSRTACSVCQAPFGPSPAVAAARVGSLLFACFHEADFTCKACGIRSPVGALDLDDQAACWGCGLVQAFDVAQWTDALGFAHGVADLSGPEPEGQNPVPGRPIHGRSRHVGIGAQFTSSTKTQNAMIMDARGTRNHSLRTTVSPGHPLCKACRTPLEVQCDAGTTRTRCPRCNDSAAYALPGSAVSCYPALRGVIAGEHRTDHPIARITRGAGGVENPGCPQCGAALVAGDGDIVTCTYCRTIARVPGRLARRQKTGPAPKMDPFWVLLDGLSPGRQELMRGRSEDDDDDDDDEPVPPGASMNAPTGAVPSWAHPNAQNAQNAMRPSRSGLTILVIVGALVALVALGVVGFVVYQLQNTDDAPAPPPKPPAKAAPAKPHHP